MIIFQIREVYGGDIKILFFSFYLRCARSLYKTVYLLKKYIRQFNLTSLLILHEI